jgi:hypothetical protein
MRIALTIFALLSVALAVPNAEYVARDPQHRPIRPPGNTCSNTDNPCPPVSIQPLILYLHRLKTELSALNH